MARQTCILGWAAFRGARWETDRKSRLRNNFKALMKESSVHGLLLCEVGNMSDFLQADARKNLEDVITDAFRLVGATELGDTHIFWKR